MEDSTSSPANPDTHSPQSAASLRELEERARAALSAQRGEMTRLETEISKQLDAITAAITEHRSVEAGETQQADEARDELERFRRQTEAAQTAWERERAEQEAELAKLQEKLEQRGSKQEEQSSQLVALRRDLDARQADLEKQSDALAEREAELEKRAEDFQAASGRQEAAQESFAAREAAWNEERSSLEAARDELLEQVAKLEADREASNDDGQSQLAGFERKLQEQQSLWSEQREEWNAAEAKLERERDELKQKFELALEDVQRFRGRAADLEQELARRPEANEADSAELVALRAERDALAERVEQLERQPAREVDGNSEQQVADLQRRFELAVEDVRELKTKNAQLESRLAAAAERPAAHADSGGMDWESQKRRMLASLAEEGEDAVDEDREKERTTIEGTIEMTDAVVAEKDREIQELKTQLATLTSATADTRKGEQDEKVNELLNADEVIAEHRKRIAQVERAMEDKLRTAELEMSVERAKLARQKVELEELRSDLETQRQTMEAGGGAAGGAPRRRWLSKLGLSGEEPG